MDVALAETKGAVGTLAGRTAAGTWIEGAGTSPDVVVETTVADRISKKDPQLTKALEMIDTETAATGAAQVLSVNGVMGLQGFDLPPTVGEMRALQAISAKDGFD